MGKYGTYAIKFKDGTYMNKDHGKTKDMTKAHKYISTDYAYGYNWFRFDEMSIVHLNDNNTETVVCSFEECKEMQEETRRYLNHE